MNRTRWLFLAIIVAAVAIVAVSLFAQSRNRTEAGALVVDRPDTVDVRLLTSLPVEPWVRSAADAFNAGDFTVDGVPIRVEIEAVDGLTALGSLGSQRVRRAAARCATGGPL